MSIEHRRETNKRYFTEVRRIEGRLVKEYIGPLSIPAVELLYREHRLGGANRTATDVAIKDEIERSKAIESYVAQIATWTKTWPTLSRLALITRDTISSPIMSVPPNPLPNLDQFTRVSQLANEGNAKANAKLDQWLDDYPALLDEATDLLLIARETMIGEMAGGSAETEALLRAKIQRKSKDILGTKIGSELNSLYADAVVLAWMDLMRCGMAALRSDLSIQALRYWESAQERAQQRWVNIEREYRRAANQEPR